MPTKLDHIEVIGLCILCRILEGYDPGRFAKEGADPRTVARQVGMKDHRELAEYMRVKGYEWSSEKGNYVRRVGEIEDTNGPEETETLQPTKQLTLPSRTRLTEGGQSYDEYLPLLEFLKHNEERLLELLSPASSTGRIPRFAVPGTTKTKSVYMSDLLSRLVAEFSESKNISQREIVVGALVEYLRRYGFQREIEALLRRS